MSEGDMKIRELVDKFDRGEILLPEMQRKYVWAIKDVCHLLDSLYREYPSGTILTWESGDKKVVQRKSAIKASKQTSGSSNLEFLLDGQQRITSLAALFYGHEIEINGKSRKIDILFNLKHTDKTTSTKLLEDENGENEESDSDSDDENENEDDVIFAASRGRGAKPKHWISVASVFKEGASTYKILKEAGLEEDEECHDRLRKLLNIKDYTYRVYKVDKGKSLEEAVDIFVRVNNRGKKLSSSELAMAQITSKWEGALKKFQDAEKKYSEQGCDIKMEVLLRALMAVSSHQCKFGAISKLNEKKLQKAWAEMNKSMRYSVKFLQGNVGIENVSLLTSPFIATAVAYHYHQSKNRLSEEESKNLRYWVLMANLRRRYSTSAETALDQDVKAIHKAIKNKSSAALSLLRNLREQGERLVIEDSDIESQLTKHSPYFTTMFLAFKAKQAKDWDSKAVICFNKEDGRRKLEFHHIFPIKVLEDNGCDEQEINDIRNLMFLDEKTNKRLGKTAPSKYLKKVHLNSLRAQCIPEEQDLWKLKNYDQFLEKRGKLIMERLKEFLGPPPAGI